MILWCCEVLNNYSVRCELYMYVYVCVWYGVVWCGVFVLYRCRKVQDDVTECPSKFDWTYTTDYKGTILGEGIKVRWDKLCV